jgi:hypothetical protein
MTITQPEADSAMPIAHRIAESLREQVRGDVFSPGEPGYDESRTIWNGMHDKRPALAIRPSGVADVILAVNVARENGMRLSIKGGGHNVAGNAVVDDGLLLDLSRMRGVHINPESHTAYVEGGALWGDFDHEAAQFKLAATGGIISTTGVAGLTLGGGIGWLNPKFGAACDNVLAYDLVLADGRFVRASTEEHPDLFWALKGGSGNFGVATGFLFRLHPFDHQVLAGARFYPISQTRDLLEFYRDFTRSSSRDVVSYCVVFMNPATGEYACAMPFCHSGSPESAEREMEPVRTWSEAALDIISPMPYTAWQQAFDPFFPHGRGYYWKSLLFTELTDAVLDIVAEVGPRKPNAISSMVIEQFGGAYGEVDKTATAFWHRDIRHQSVIIGAWDDPADKEPCISWARELYTALMPHAANSNLNFTVLDDDEKSQRIRSSYGDNWDRLVQVKMQYDPTNFFRVNNNIPPRE